MSFSPRISAEKVALVVAALAVSAGAGWWWREQPALNRLRHESAAVALVDAPYVRAELPPAAARAKAWGKPGAQSHGAGWVYEVFTPPVIYYHALARSFTVTPPTFVADGGAPFGLELLDVALEPYRLQLVGYIGAPGNYVAAFVSPRSPETYLARTGRRFEGLGLALKEFGVRKVAVATDDQWPVFDVAAIAVVVDESSGEEVVLDSRRRKLTDTPLALLRIGAGTKPREFREGDIFQDETAIYRIDRIQLDPPEVVVAKQVTGLPYPETRVLKPVAEKSVRKPGVPAGMAEPRSRANSVAHSGPRP